MLTNLRVLACIFLAVGLFFAFGVTVMSVKEGETFSSWFEGMLGIALPFWAVGGLLFWRSTNGRRA